MMTRQILFEHIPKTGGLTLRGILQKVYGKEHIFFITSNNIGSSLKEFSGYTQSKRDSYRVIAGHGAQLFEPYLSAKPFRITVLREPISLFISQFYFLKIRRESLFYDDMQKIGDIEAYLDYACKMGHDNLLTRFLGNSMSWAANPGSIPTKMEIEGERILATAKKNMLDFDAVIGLNDFDTDIFALAKLLNWRGVPIYKPTNRNKKKPARPKIENEFLDKLRRSLRFDIDLYDHFLKNREKLSEGINKNAPAFKTFILRQNLVKYMARITGRN